jgi:hypothetical protein
MKTITTTVPVRKADPSLDAKLNPVELSSREIVSVGRRVSEVRIRHNKSLG